MPSQPVTAADPRNNGSLAPNLGVLVTRTHLSRALVASVLAFSMAACSDDPTSDPDQDVALVDAGDDADTSIDVPDPDVIEETTPDVEPDTEDAPDVEDTTEDAPEDVPEDIVEDVPPPTCETAEQCDDGLACTTDLCPEDIGHCVWEVNAGSCLSGRECFATGDRPASQPCLVCNPDIDPLALVPVGDGTACDDGNICTVDTTCSEGVCVGSELACEDGNPCTDNACEPGLGCIFPPALDGTTCDDGTACTSDDACFDGTCVGAPITCFDSNPCTDDVCDDALGCQFPNNTAPCEDGNLCTDGDTCADGACVPGGPTNCEDGDACTFDICDEFAGCVWVPNLNPCCIGGTSICDDSNPCTTDICNPADGSCQYENNTAVCSDGSDCTEGDTCVEGECIGGDVACEDTNPCTADLCDEDGGCVFEPLDDTPCDDGIACTIDDYCSAGVCVAGTSECVCDPILGNTAIKLTSMRIGSGGRPGEALDLDGNPATCAPMADCSDGRHNALGVIGPFANESLAEAVGEGELIIVLDIDDIGLNPFEIALHQGELAPGSESCDLTTDICDYLVSRSGFDDETCAPQVTLPATRSGSTIVAGGPGTLFPFDVPLGDSTLTITLYDVRFEGTVTIDGDSVTSMQGIIGGAVPRAQLIAALESLDPDSLPLDPSSIISLLEILVRDDIDTDGDGNPDAASIGIPVAGIGANVVGAD